MLSKLGILVFKLGILVLFSYWFRLEASNVPTTPAFTDTSTPFHPTTPAAVPITPSAGGSYPSMATVGATPAATPYEVTTPMNPQTPMAVPSGGDFYAQKSSGGSGGDSWITSDIQVRIIPSKSGQHYKMITVRLHARLQTLLSKRNLSSITAISSLLRKSSLNLWLRKRKSRSKFWLGKIVGRLGICFRLMVMRVWLRLKGMMRFLWWTWTRWPSISLLSSINCTIWKLEVEMMW